MTQIANLATDKATPDDLRGRTSNKIVTADLLGDSFNVGVDNKLVVLSLDERQSANRPSLISPIQDWHPIAQGSPASAYPARWQSLNGYADENAIEMGIAPDGVERPLWACLPDGNNGADGGWSESRTDIDPSKRYRISCWIKRNSNDGHSYFGVNQNSNMILDNRNGAVVNNPYVYVVGSPALLNEWLLVVGYIHPANTPNDPVIRGGVYTRATGLSRITEVGYEFRFAPSATWLGVRAYQFYTTADYNTTRQWMFNPRIDVCDGTEPTIAELLYLTNSAELIFPELINSWTNFNSDHQPFSASLNNGVVTLTGLVQGGVVGAPLAVLPEAYRPIARNVSIQHYNAGMSRIDVDPNGNVTIADGLNGWVTVNISYPAAWFLRGERR